MKSVDTILDKISATTGKECRNAGDATGDSRGYLPKVIYRRPPHLSSDFASWANRQISYINRYGHILRQPEIRTRQDKLQRFLEAHSEVATQTPMQIYCAFADSLPVIHAYRALCLTASQYKQMASAKRIVAKGAYKKSLATCIAHEIAFGYWRGVRSRLHLAPPLPLDFTLSLHGDKQIALAVALYSWRTGDKIYLFTVEIPRIMVLDLRIPQVSPNTHYFWFMDIPFNADEPDLEFFVLNKIDFVPFVKSVQVFADHREIRRELAGLQAKQQAKYDADKQAYLHSAAYRQLSDQAQRLKAFIASTSGDYHSSPQLAQFFQHPSYPHSSEQLAFFRVDQAEHLATRIATYLDSDSKSNGGMCPQITQRYADEKE